MEFIGCDHSIFRIAEFPPELMADHGDIDCRLRFSCILDSVNHACRCKKQNYDNQYRDHRPREFDLRASINLCRLSLRILGVPPESVEDIHQQSEDQRKKNARLMAVTRKDR